MNNTKTIWSAVVVIAIISIIGLFAPHGSAPAASGDGLAFVNPATVSNYTSLGVLSMNVGTGCDNNTSTAKCNGLAGSVSAGTVISGVIQSAGVNSVWSKVPVMLTASTTPCSIPFPTGTSTLVAYDFTISQSTTSATVYSLSTSTSQYSTTTATGAISTPFATTTLAANSQGTFSWDPGYTSGMMVGTSSPNSNGQLEYVVLGVAGGTAGTAVTTTAGNLVGGSCSANFTTPAATTTPISGL